MATDRLGTGFTFHLEDSAGANTYTQIGDILSGQWSGITRDAVEVTDTEDEVRKYVAGLTSAGTLTLRIAYDGGDATQEALQDEAYAGTTSDGKDVAIHHSKMAEYWLFTGFITSFVPGEYTPGGHISATLTYQINTVDGPTSGAVPTA